MSFKVLIPPETVKLIGQLHISRWLKLRLLNYLHNELPNHTPKLRQIRLPYDERAFVCTAVFHENNVRHFFAAAIDATPAAGRSRTPSRATGQKRDFERWDDRATGRTSTLFTGRQLALSMESIRRVVIKVSGIPRFFHAVGLALVYLIGTPRA